MADNDKEEKIEELLSKSGLNTDSNQYGAREADSKENQLSNIIYEAGLISWEQGLLPPDFCFVVASGLGKLLACHGGELTEEALVKTCKTIGDTALLNYHSARVSVVAKREAHEEIIKATIEKLLKEAANDAQTNTRN